MDPVCHTLVGAVLSGAGLNRLTTRATATLVIAANLPDIDVIAIPFGQSLAWRRGITHGLPVLVLWPFLLAAVIWAWDQWRSRPDQPPVSFRGLVLIGAIGVVTHPFLDYLNNYGMRWLMPLQDRWFYGDSVFIVDPWLYLILGVATWLGWRARRAGDSDPARPARIGVALATLYLGALIGTTMVARSTVVEELGPISSTLRFMATAVPVDPLTKQLVIDDGASYRVGSVRLGRRPRVVIDSSLAKGAHLQEAERRLAATGIGRAFLHWARFPVAVETGVPGVIRVFDLRYGDGRAGSWASMEVSITDPVSR